MISIKNRRQGTIYRRSSKDLDGTASQISQAETQLSSLNSKLEYSTGHLYQVKEQAESLTQALEVAETMQSEDKARNRS